MAQAPAVLACTCSTHILQHGTCTVVAELVECGVIESVAVLQLLLLRHIFAHARLSVVHKSLGHYSTQVTELLLASWPCLRRECQGLWLMSRAL